MLYMLSSLDGHNQCMTLKLVTVFENYYPRFLDSIFIFFKWQLFFYWFILVWVLLNLSLSYEIISHLFYLTGLALTTLPHLSCCTELTMCYKQHGQNMHSWLGSTKENGALVGIMWLPGVYNVALCTLNEICKNECELTESWDYSCSP